MKHRGFSLVEMVITITILAIIMSYGYRSFSHSRIKVEAETDRQYILRIPVLLEQYYADKLSYPKRLDIIVNSNSHSVVTPNAYYLLSYRRERPNNYLLTATLNTSKASADKVRCAVITISASGKLAGYDKQGKPAGDACWK